MGEAELLEGARSALLEGRWSDAEDGFRQVLADARDPEALDGLGLALWWQGRGTDAIASRKDAYAIFRRRGDLALAARIAIWLAHEYAAQGGEAVARGWRARAERLCADLPEGPEHGWLALANAEEAADPEVTERHARDALAIARVHDDADLEIRALAASAVAAIAAGRIDDGIASFGEAMAAATGGEATGLDVLGDTYCDMYRAIGILGDNAPFREWTDELNGFLMRTKHAAAMSFCGSCCGELMTAAGQVEAAEAEMLRSIRELEAQGQRARCVHPAAKLAELRVLQGRTEEAERLVAGYEGLPETVRARAMVAMARGEFAVAASLLDRRLNAIGGDTLLSLPHLTLLLEALVAKGDLDGARAVAARLDTVAAITAHSRAEGEAARGHARVAAAEGDVVAARAHLERALESFARAGKVIEEARARLLLAETLATADPALAIDEARAALATFERLDCRRDADAASALLRALTGEGRTGPKGFGTLSRREHEVLKLLSEGLTNAEIASRLFISTKTAGNHVSNILMKTGLRSRGEAAAWAIRAEAAGARG